MAFAMVVLGSEHILQTWFSFISEKRWWFSSDFCWELRGLESLRRDLLVIRGSANIYTCKHFLNCGILANVLEQMGQQSEHATSYAHPAMGEHTMGLLTKPSNIILASWSLEQNSNKMCWYLFVGGKTECFGQHPGDDFHYSEAFPSLRQVKAHCAMT